MCPLGSSRYACKHAMMCQNRSSFNGTIGYVPTDTTLWYVKGSNRLFPCLLAQPWRQAFACRQGCARGQAVNGRRKNGGNYHRQNEPTIHCNSGNPNLYLISQLQNGDDRQLGAMTHSPLTVLLPPGWDCVAVCGSKGSGYRLVWIFKSYWITQVKFYMLLLTIRERRFTN